MNDIVLDPVTEKEFTDAVSKAFDDFAEALDIEALEEMGVGELSEMMFFNGFLRGAMAMLDDDSDLWDTLYILKKEIVYQTKE